MNADKEVSSNWSGYVATGIGSTTNTASATTQFKRVTATWQQPAATCTGTGTASASAVWVGLGGYSTKSTALEQTGTSADCSAAGKASYYAWYELVPEPSITIKNLKIFPGDLITASVVVNGTEVLLRSRTGRGRPSSRSASRSRARPDLRRVDRRGAVGVLLERLLPADRARQLRLGHLHEGRGARERSTASATRAARSRARSGSRRRSSSCRARGGSSATSSSVPMRPPARRARRRRAVDRRQLVQRQLGRERDGDRMSRRGCCARGRGAALAALAVPAAAWAAATPAQLAVQRRELVVQGLARRPVGHAAPEVQGRRRGPLRRVRAQERRRASGRSRSSASRPKGRRSST